ncbi:MAG: phosphotransferase family protein, partial [Acidimicrobiales bacterium]
GQEGLIDVGRLSGWLDLQAVAPGKQLSWVRMGSGRSNEMFCLSRGGERIVLRRPAKLPLEGADQGMAREYRVLQALEGTPVPHPPPIALCTDPRVLGCTFYLMGWVDGFMPADPLPGPFSDREAHRELAFAIVDPLVELGLVDWRAQGLGDFGRPDDFHRRQVSRWNGQYQSYRRQELDGIENAAGWLGANMPGSWTPGIMHGDYHTANLLMCPGRPARVAAVCDWETATIGDPLVDLAGFLRFWMEAHPESDEWPRRQDLIDRYSERSGRDTSDLLYYSVLAQFRLAVTIEGIYQRSHDDPTRPLATDMHSYAMMLVNGLAELIG